MRVLIIGLGSIAEKHVFVLRQLFKEVTIYALRSGTNKSESDGIRDIYHLDELSVKPDFVIVSNPTFLHVNTLKYCLALKVPVMIEKPLSDAQGYDELTKLIPYIEENNILTYCACNLRFHPVILFLKENIGKKRINEVNIYCGSWLPGWRSGKDFRHSYSAKPEMGGGVYLDLIHEIDYCFWLFGAPEKVYSVKTNKSSLSIKSIDFASYNLLYRDF
jgi:predicted dehydrogenase